MRKDTRRIKVLLSLFTTFLMLGAVQETARAQTAAPQQTDDELLKDRLAKTKIVSSNEFGEVTVPARAQLPVEGLATPFTAVVGDSLYLIGGHIGDQHNYHPWNFTRSVWKADLSNIGLDSYKMKWIELPSRPTKSMGSNDAAVWHNKIYVFGGFTNKWTEKDGEYDDSFNPRINATYWQSSSVVDVFDTETDTWRSLTETGFPQRSSAGVVQMGSKVYFVGGWDAGSVASGSTVFFETVGVFDLETETYTETDIRLPDPGSRRAVIATQWTEDEFVMAGGLGVGAEVWVFNVTNEQWTRIADLPFKTTNAQIIGLRGSLYLVGGSTGASDGRNIFYYDDLNDVWVNTYLQLNRQISSARLVPFDEDKALILGGYINNAKDDPFIPTINGEEHGSSPVSDVEVFQAFE